jgi:beta-lactamase class A
MKRPTELIRQRPLITLIFIIVLLLSVAVLFYSNAKFKSGYAVLDQKNDILNDKFEMLSPSISWMETEDFLAMQKTYSLNYQTMKQQVIDQLATSPNEEYGFYFEDLNTGAWVGINEKERLKPMSLFKVPIMMIVLKKVQENNISMDLKVLVRPEDLDSRSGSLASKGSGYEMTVKELITTMIQDSDNTAMEILASRFITDEDYLDLIGLIGFPQSSETVSISPKEYINMFRSLYYSTYLRRPFSQLALTILANTNFNSQLVAGVPSNVKVSHKFGVSISQGVYHDCGIVYLPGKPYLICVMGKNTTQEKADEMISKISKIVYDYNAKLVGK